jgi:hypothetical protein
MHERAFFCLPRSKHPKNRITSVTGQLFTLPEFCDRNRLKPTSYFKLRKRGQGPRETRILSRVFISPEAESDWRREREQPDVEDLKTIERLQQRARKAGQASVASEKRLAR